MDDEQPPLLTRRSNLSDVDAVKALIGVDEHIVDRRYGNFDIAALIDEAAFACTCTDHDGNVVGFASFRDLPNNGVNDENLTPSKWQSTLRHKYGLVDVHVSDTMFLTLALADHLYEVEVMYDVFKGLFNEFPYITNVLYVLPTAAGDFAPIRDLFNVVMPLSGTETQFRVMMTTRDTFVPTMVIRDARVEDHDDLVPVFDAQSDILAGQYGQYFLADLMGSQDLHNRCLVAEVKGKANGLLSLSSDVDISLLHKCFELEPYDCLVNQYQELVAQAREDLIAERAAKKAADRQARIEFMRKQRQAQREKKRQEEEAARIQAEVELAREAAEKSTKKGKKDKDKKRAQLDLQKAERLARERVEKQIREEQEAMGEQEEEEIELPEEVEEPEPELVLEDLDLSGMQTNCFAVNLFCLEQGLGARASEFLQPAFELFPDKEYCILTLPHDCQPTSLMPFFYQVPSKPSSTFGYVLYIVHRAALTRTLEIDRVVDDKAALEKLGEFLSFMPEQEKAEHMADVKARCKKGASSEERATFSVLAEGQIVGVVSCTLTAPAESYRKYFDCDNLINFTAHEGETYLQLDHMIVNPIFYTRVHEVYRLLILATQKTAIFHRLPLGTKPPPYLDYFIHAPPRRVRKSNPDHPSAEGSNPLTAEPFRAEEVVPPLDPRYLLFVTNRKYVTLPKMEANSRVVVVGASDTGLTFIETLLQLPHIRFTNLTLISPEGLQTTNNPRFQYIPSPLSYADNELELMAIGECANVVQGRLVNIDRDTKEVILSDSSRLPYDVLVLTCGLQDQRTTTLFKKLDYSVGGVYSPDRPQDALELDEVLQEGSIAADKMTGKVVINGDGLEVLVSLQRLLEMGFDGSQCTIVTASAEPNFELPTGRPLEMVMSELKNLGVTIHTNRLIKEVDTQAREIAGVVIDVADKTIKEDDDEESVSDQQSTRGSALADGGEDAERRHGRKSAASRKHEARESVAKSSSRASVAQGGDGGKKESSRLSSASGGFIGGKSMKVPCRLLIHVSHKAVDTDVFFALNSNSIVFDGRVIVDHQFRTNDSCIYAGGNFVKFSRKYRQSRMLTEFSSRELGRVLAKCVLQGLHIEPDDSLNTTVAPETLVPEFSAPKAVSALVPNGLHLMHLYSSEQPLDLPDGYHMDGGRDLITETDNGITMIHLDVYQKVTRILYLGKLTIDEPWSMMNLLGLPDSILNNMANRYDQGVIPDLMDFIQETWACTLYHDRFLEFRKQTMQELRTNPELQKLHASVSEHLNASLILKGGKFPKLSVQTKIELDEALLSFLYANREHLYMYLTKEAGQFLDAQVPTQVPCLPLR
jgi:flagellar biosynthesis GTPase FlhF